MTAAITYADRLLAFLVPLFVLKGLNNEDAYSVVEFIISISVMVATFGDLGVRNYILYQYRKTGNKADTTALTLAGYCCVLLLQCCAIGVTAIVMELFGGAISLASMGTLIVAALLRACALGTTAMAYQLAVLHSRPALASLPSLCQWLAVLAAIFFWPKDASDTLGLAVSVPCVPFILIGLAYTAGALREVSLVQAIRQVKTAALWGWPLLASAALSIGIANVSRIYGFGHLVQSDQIAFNFWLRIFSIVQLTHATAMTTLALEIYEHREPGILYPNMQKYLTQLGGALAIVIALFIATFNWTQLAPNIDIGAFFAIGLYMLIWCAGAYLETYVTRDGRPDKVLVIAALAALAYALLLFSLRPVTVTALASVMLVAAILNVVLLARAARKTV